MLPVLLLFFAAAPAQPDTAQTHQRLAKNYETNGELDKAAAEYERAIQLSPYDESNYFNAAHMYLLRQQFDPAVQILERGCKIFDKSAQLSLALGVAYYGERKFDRAATAFLRTIDVDPGVEQPYLFLTRMLDQAVDRMPEILPRFKHWAEANPKNALAQFAFAKVLLASNDQQTAEKLLRHSIALKPDQWESHYELGVLLEKQRNFAEAAAELERSIAINANQADAHYHLSRVYDRLGQSDKAAAERQTHERLTQANGVK